MRAAVLPALLATVLLGGCSTAVPGTALPTSASTDPSAAAAASSAPTSATGDATADDDTPAAADPASAAFCDAARADVALVPGLTDALTGNGDLAAVVAKIKASNAAVEAAAPADIKADVVTTYALSDKELDLIARADGDPTKLLQDPSFGQAVTDASAASGRVSAYLKTNCGVDVSSILSGLGG